MLVPQQTQASSIAGISDKLKDSAFFEQDSSEACDPRKASITLPVLQEQLPGALSSAGQYGTGSVIII
jgi:hypothetical protein